MRRDTATGRLSPPDSSVCRSAAMYWRTSESVARASRAAFASCGARTDGSRSSARWQPSSASTTPVSSWASPSCSSWAIFRRSFVAVRWRTSDDAVFCSIPARYSPSVAEKSASLVRYGVVARPSTRTPSTVPVSALPIGVSRKRVDESAAQSGRSSDIPYVAVAVRRSRSTWARTVSDPEVVEMSAGSTSPYPVEARRCR